MSALARRRSEVAIENDERNLNFSVVMLSLISLLDSIMSCEANNVFYARCSPLASRPLGTVAPNRHRVTAPAHASSTQ